MTRRSAIHAGLSAVRDFLARGAHRRARFARGARHWARSKSGNVAVIFALSLLPIVTASGAAVDISRALIVKARLASALDAAGLAVGSSVGMSDTALKELATRFFEANYPTHELGETWNLNVNVTDSVVTISASAKIETLILGVVGRDYIYVNAESEITRESKGLEVVMVLDNTGSMRSNGKIEALRDAATELVGILFGEEAFPEKLSMALVPFVTAVNIRAEPDFDMSWIDTNRPARARYHGVNFDTYNGGPVNHLDLFDWSGADWKGCVEMRAEPYDVSDDPPDPADPDTLFVPYFWPDDPDFADADEYHNDWLDDNFSGSGSDDEATVQRDLEKYWDPSGARLDDSPSTTWGPNKSCAEPLVPLTNDRDMLLDEVAAMRAWNNSGTNAAAGLVWGWRVLSPGVPFTSGKPYDDPENKKALILLTDGENQIWGGWDSHNRSNYSSYGYLALERLGTDRRHPAADAVDDKVALLCERIKATGVRIYTITFRLNSSSVREVFRQCATEPELYFDSPSNEELQVVFNKIAQDLSNLRISR